MLKNNVPDHNVTVQWVENGLMKQIPLTPGHSAIYQSQLLISMVSFIRLSAYNDRYMPALVNGNLYFDMEPRDDDEFVNISITPKERDNQSFVTPKEQQNQRGGDSNLSNITNMASTNSSQEQQQHFYMSPSFKNMGMKTVTFRFPPKDGKLITLPPYGEVYLNARESSLSKPNDWIVEFSEGDKKYNLTLAWKLKPTGTDVSVGNGKATVSTTETDGHEAGEQASQGFVPQTQGAGGNSSEKQGPMSKLRFL